MASTFLNNIEWIAHSQPVAYEPAIDLMEKRVQDIIDHRARDCLWFLEHPPVYTLGTSGQASDCLDPNVVVVKTGRGGKTTFHGPGQRIVYVMMDLNRRNRDLRDFVRRLEKWIVLTLEQFGITGWTDPDRVGVWVHTPRGDEKIAAIGVRVRKWVTFHGFALNLSPDLTLFDKIIPCGLGGFGVCSMHSLGVFVSMADLDKVLKQTFAQAFEIC